MAVPPLIGADEVGEGAAVGEVVGEGGDGSEDGVGVTSGVNSSGLAVGETSSGGARVGVGETDWQAVRIRTVKTYRILVNSFRLRKTLEMFIPAGHHSCFGLSCIQS